MTPKHENKPPESYTRFLRAAQAYVKSKGIDWDIPIDSTGAPLAGRDWDLRVLTDSHARAAAHLNGFAVHAPTRQRASLSGWSERRFPSGRVLSRNVQDFLKAVVATRCELGYSPRETRQHANIYRRFFSVTSKQPWQLNTEDFDAFSALTATGGRDSQEMTSLATLINQNLLSTSCPIEPAIQVQVIARLHASLTERKHEDKLPDKETLQELVRILFHEVPRSHSDGIKFDVSKLLLFTGLRLNEILMLPTNCLTWETHTDYVTGRPADEVGGAARSLKLRYFALKHEDGAPDVLVEEFQPVPAMFQDVVVSAVERALKSTARLRQLLGKQHANPLQFPKSDLRHFQTSLGTEIRTSDLLFLVLIGGKGPMPARLRRDAAVGIISQNAVYQGLGMVYGRRKGAPSTATLFTTYGRSKGARKMRIEPHALRHLMNTEYFRLEVPDTITTLQFGRKSIAQSYEYDHRTLLERLKFVQLPSSSRKTIKVGSSQELVAKMIVAGVVDKSNLARTFKAIQSRDGDEAAFRYLAANSDGFHVTPYGYCTTSFSLNPCARHLKCFDGCSQFVVSGRPEHRLALDELRKTLSTARQLALSKPTLTVGRKNQIEHATKLLAGVTAALEAHTATVVFSDGVDHSMRKKDLFQ